MIGPGLLCWGSLALLFRGFTLPAFAFVVAHALYTGAPRSLWGGTCVVLPPRYSLTVSPPHSTFPIRELRLSHSYSKEERHRKGKTVT